MSKYHIFVSQTGSLAPSGLNVSGTYSYWANASGALMVTLADWSVRNAASNFGLTGAREAIRTTTGVFTPTYWIPGDFSGNLIAIPAYARTV